MLTMAAVLIAVAALGGITLATLHLRQKGLPMARFRDYTYTDKLFAKHGMKSVGYWTALDEPVKSSTFFYILEHPSREAAADRKSTRLNSSHGYISYAVFCLKKKKYMSVCIHHM